MMRRLARHGVAPAVWNSEPRMRHRRRRRERAPSVRTVRHQPRRQSFTWGQAHPAFQCRGSCPRQDPPSIAREPMVLGWIMPRPGMAPHRPIAQYHRRRVPGPRRSSWHRHRRPTISTRAPWRPSARLRRTVRSSRPAPRSCGTRPPIRTHGAPPHRAARAASTPRPAGRIPTGRCRANPNRYGHRRMGPRIQAGRNATPAQAQKTSPSPGPRDSPWRPVNLVTRQRTHSRELSGQPLGQGPERAGGYGRER
jgi:hypothetical protein